MLCFPLFEKLQNKENSCKNVTCLRQVCHKSLKREDFNLKHHETFSQNLRYWFYVHDISDQSLCYENFETLLIINDY